MGQVLKTKIKERILENALNAFILKGFKNTTMKGIAEKSGIAVGNIYNYFKDKEALYDSLVQPVFNEINNIFEKPFNINDPNILDNKIKSFIDIYKSNKDIFMMLLEHSSDTKFESLKKTIIDNFTLAVVRYKNNVIPTSSQAEDHIFIKAFTGAFINGIIYILDEKVDEKIKFDRLYEFMAFMKDSLHRKLTYKTGEIK